MKTSDTSGTGKKPRESREIRQQRILDATVRCVRRSGFHAASMADIAAEAKISVGIIYRYFANKEAIIEAIVAKDMAEMRAKFGEWDATPDDKLLDSLLNIVDEAIEHHYGLDKAGLALEVLAEAARNPRVASMVARADAQERELGRALWRRIAPDLKGEALAAREEVMVMLFDGMMVRAVSNPNVDRAALGRAFKQAMRVLMTLPPDEA
jgi:AcrR family transcriptional regulator